MSMITQKDLYEDAILKQFSGDHVHQAKWVSEFNYNTVILWEEVRSSVHNFLS